MEPYRYWMEHELLQELVAEPDSGAPAPSTVVSVDYDFFVPHYDRIRVVGGDADELVRADPSCPLDHFAASLAGRFRFVEAFVADSHVWGSYSSPVLRGAPAGGSDWIDCDPPLGIRVGDQDACTPRPFPRRAPE